MTIVNERYSPAKPVQVDPKTGKPLPSSTPARAASPTLADTNLGLEKDNGFFGSFFAAKNKKKAASMAAPPPFLKASGTLSERENIEVEIISKSQSSGNTPALHTHALRQNSLSSHTTTSSSAP